MGRLARAGHGAHRFQSSWFALWLSELGARVTGAGPEPDTTPNLFGQLELARRLDRHHLEAQPLVRRSYRDPLGTWAINMQGSLHGL